MRQACRVSSVTLVNLEFHLLFQDLSIKGRPDAGISTASTLRQKHMRLNQNVRPPALPHSCEIRAAYELACAA